MAILNSKLTTFYHFNSSPKATKGAFPKILVEDIKYFPLPLINAEQEEKIIKKVDEILFKKQSDSLKVEDLENEIDVMVYKLYDLTYDEVLLVEPEFSEHMSKEEYENLKVE